MKRLPTTLILAIGCLISSGELLAEGPKADFPANSGQLTVMTRNLYVGTDVFRLFSVPPEEIPLEMAAMLQTVVGTDFYGRANALADEIARTRPHLIGLQEVSLIRYQSPGDFLAGNPVPAEDVLFDYLEILLNSLESQGEDYYVAAWVQDSDIELPLATLSGLDDVRLTDFDVILARGDVDTSNAVSQNYLARVALSAGGISIEFLRGFAAVDATVKYRTYRFVNTHLEVAAFGPVQGIQAQELASFLDAETLPVILVGDLNSGPGEGGYTVFDSAGYIDTWLAQVGRIDEGWTCCQDEDLLNETSNLTERIDHVFFLSEGSSELGPVQATLTGEDPLDKTLSGLWPSDHAGVVARIRLQSLLP